MFTRGLAFERAECIWPIQDRSPGLTFRDRNRQGAVHVGEQSASRLGGDDYQHLYSWSQILQLLDPASRHEFAVIEHPKAGAADDITFHPTSNASAPTLYYQIKWHRDYRYQYSFGSLVRIGSRTGSSLLQRLFTSWQQLRLGGPVEVWLVSNYAAAPSPDLGSYLTDKGWLKPALFTKGTRSLAGKGLQLWVRSLQTSDTELAAFCKDLRFELGYHGRRRLFEQFDDKMAHWRLITGDKARAQALNEIRQRIQEGGHAKRITRDDLVETIARLGLREDVSNPPEVRLVIHGWARQGYEGKPTAELDWTSFFDREHRRVASPEMWASTLLPQLRAARAHLERLPNGKYMDVRGKMPLTTALAVGFAFPVVAGFSLRAEQPSAGGTNLWRSDAPPSKKRFVVVQEHGELGQDIVIGLAVTGNGLQDMERLSSSLRANAFIYAEPDGGPGPTSVQSESDAVALAQGAKDVIRDARQKYAASRVHLVFFGPVSIALFLGQLLNAVGTIVTYERTAEGEYQQSVTLTSA